jgi:hypothetical protein
LKLQLARCKVPAFANAPAGEPAPYAFGGRRFA